MRTVFCLLPLSWIEERRKRLVSPFVPIYLYDCGLRSSSLLVEIPTLRADFKKSKKKSQNNDVDDGNNNNNYRKSRILFATGKIIHLRLHAYKCIRLARISYNLIVRTALHSHSQIAKLFEYLI